VRALALIATLTTALLIAACAEDRIPDPYDADPPPPLPTYDLSTEEGAAEALATMLTASDTAAVRMLLLPDATMQLEPGETARFGWPVSSLLARELQQALINLLAGAPVSVPGGGLQPGVDSLRVSRWDLGVAFHDVWAGGREGGYRVEVTAYADGDTMLSPIIGWLMVRVLADTVDGEPVHHVAGLRDLTGEDLRPAVDGPTLGRVLIDYLANQPAAVEVTVTPPSGQPGTRFALDARGSRDPEGGPLTFRFRIGDAERPWTSWSSAATLDTVFLSPATLAITVAARDRWLLEGAGFATITILP
jgi:hypothetical protein